MTESCTEKTAASPFTLALKVNFLKEVAGCGIIRNTVALPPLCLLISSKVVSELNILCRRDIVGVIGVKHLAENVTI